MVGAQGPSQEWDDDLVIPRQEENSMVAVLLSLMLISDAHAQAGGPCDGLTGPDRQDCQLNNTPAGGATCGNGQVGAGEECDEGGGNSDAPDATCRTDCTLSRCGDGIVDSGLLFEECDDGNLVDGDGCDSTCTVEVTCTPLPVGECPPMPHWGTFDSDADGINDDEEALWGTSPYDVDSDGDGLTDGQEAGVCGLDPADPTDVVEYGWTDDDGNGRLNGGECS